MIVTPAIQRIQIVPSSCSCTKMLLIWKYISSSKYFDKGRPHR